MTRIDSRRKCLATAAFVLLITIDALSAQVWDRFSNPKIQIPITHAPAFPLKLTRVAFEVPQGPCSEELFDNVESAFLENDIEVLNRSHLDAVLREQGFGVSGLARQETAARVGELLGAQALVFLKVTTCKTSHLTDKKQRWTAGGPVTVYLRVTKGDFRGSVRVIDLTTGRTLKTKPFQSSYSESSQEGYPDDESVLERARELSIAQLRRLFFPWTESREVVFYEDDDKFCSLEPGYNLLKAGDLEGALAAADASYSQCRDAPGAKPKMIGRAAYDLGVVQCLRGDFEAGLTNLGEAMRMNAGDVVTSAIAECRQAKEAASRMDIYETDMATVQADLSEIGEKGAQAGGQSAHSGVPSPNGSRQTQSSVEDRLRSLQDLRKKGLIDEKEFQNRKAEILKDL
jgi:hypothetical protein